MIRAFYTVVGLGAGFFAVIQLLDTIRHYRRTPGLMVLGQVVFFIVLLFAAENLLQRGL